MKRINFFSFEHVNYFFLGTFKSIILLQKMKSLEGFQFHLCSFQILCMNYPRSQCSPTFDQELLNYLNCIKIILFKK